MVIPSVNTSSETSSPNNLSSSTKSPERLSVLMAALRSSTDDGTTTPLPAAKPSALTTISKLCCSAHSRAFSAACEPAKTSLTGDGMECFVAKLRQKALEVSNIAACAEGPKTGIEASRKASLTPAAKELSGPTTTRSMASRRHKSTTAWGSVGSTSRRSRDPPLPGATKTSSSLA